VAELQARRGFTLIELIVVIVVIAILAGLVGPMVLGNVGDAKIQAARAQIELFGLALDAYRLDNDVYPTTEQGLAALRVRPTAEPVPRRWRGPYLRKEVPLDPWGRPYVYRAPGEMNPEAYDLVSLGRDGRSGGSGEDADITSWGGGSTVDSASTGERVR
jgi:general secretion pathway protein G